MKSTVIHAPIEGKTNGNSAPPSNPSSAQQPSNSPEQLICETINQRHHIISLIQQLHHMVTAVQLHRGMSMSLLGGNRVFETEIVHLQKQLERRLLIIETYLTQSEELLSLQEKNNLQQAWLTIRHDWHDDEVLDNFELHSHFIEQLITMIMGLASQLEIPLENYIANQTQSAADSTESKTVEIPEADTTTTEQPTYPNALRVIELLNFVSEQLPNMIELLAKIRGLGSHAASVGKVEYRQDRRLRYLVQCAESQNEKIRHKSKRLNTIWKGEIPHLQDITTIEMKVHFLFETIKTDILSGHNISMEGHELFVRASDIINVYSKIIDSCWDTVRRQLDTDMEYWISHSSQNS